MDALWWSFVTVTTVGYGDISPVSSFGRVIAGLLMAFGIGFIGMLTGTIATFFIKKTEYQTNDETNKNDLDISGLNDDDIKQVHMFIDFLRSKKE